MKQAQPVVIKDLGGNLPNELIMLAYYPVTRSFNIPRYKDNDDNPEFFSMITVLLNPNFDKVIQFKRKTLAEEHAKKTERLRKRYSGERLEAELEKLSDSKDKKEADLDFLVAMKGKFFSNLSKLTPDKIASFLDGKPVLQQEVTEHNSAYQYANSMIASKYSVVWIQEQKDTAPKSSIIYCAQDKDKVNKALQRGQGFTIDPKNK